jgi:hypothetical protein
MNIICYYLFMEVNQTHTGDRTMNGKMRAYWAGAMKDGKHFRTMIMTYSVAAAKTCALKSYPAADGYTDHYGTRRI